MVFQTDKLEFSLVTEGYYSQLTAKYFSKDPALFKRIGRDDFSGDSVVLQVNVI